MNTRKELLTAVLFRALRLQCPRCGKGKIFQKWSLPLDTCSECGFPFGLHESDTWFFMYMSTAGMTGLFMIMFFLVSQDSLTVRIAVPAAAAVTFVLTHPIRKSLAYAFDFLIQPENQ